MLERLLMKFKQRTPNNLASLMSKMVEEMGYLPSVLMAKFHMKFYPKFKNGMAVRVCFISQTSSLYTHEHKL